MNTRNLSTKSQELFMNIVICVTTKGC